MLKNDSSHVLTVKELSDYLKVHPSTIYRQLKRGRLPAFKVGLRLPEMGQGFAVARTLGKTSFRD